MDTELLGELEGQTSINYLLGEPLGTVPIQLALPTDPEPSACPRPAARA